VSTVRARLDAHLASWLGEWPPSAAVSVTTSPARTTPGWDGRVLPFVGLRTPIGTVVSVAPDAVDDAQAAVRDRRVAEVVFRWCETPRSDGDPLGEWVPADDGRVPAWLRPFGHDVLVAFDPATGTYAAGVGLKRHDDHAWELSVGTDAAHEGRGLARRLVARAAARVLDEGRVPTYLHDPDNHASARVADAAGFPDVGWRLLVLRDD
jgi:RimJ/RimL family protein N-acetyltransferase